MSFERKFPSFLDAFMECYKHVDAPYCYKYWTAMSALAGAVERKVWWTNGSAYWYPNLYVFLVGERGTRKSTIAGKAVDMLWKMPEFELAPTEMNSASILFTLKDIGQRRSFEYNGKHYKNSSFYMYGSEAVKIFGEMSTKDSSIKSTIVEFFNCGDSFWTDRPFAKKSTRTFGEEAVFNPCINILACSTSEWLMTKILRMGDVAGGLGSRILFAVFPEDDTAERPTVMPTPEQLVAQDLVTEDLMEIAKLKGPMTATRDWVKAWDAYQKMHKKAQRALKHTDEMLQGCLARKANTQLVKISMLLAIDECQDGELVMEARHCHKAWDLLEELQKHMPMAFGKYGVSEEVQHIHSILYYLDAHNIEEVTIKELAKIFSKKYNATTIKAGVMDLVVQGKLEIDRSKMAGRDRIYRVISSPKSNQLMLPPAQSEDQPDHTLL